MQLECHTCYFLVQFQHFYTATIHRVHQCGSTIAYIVFTQSRSKRTIQQRRCQITSSEQEYTIAERYLRVRLHSYQLRHAQTRMHYLDGTLTRTTQLLSHQAGKTNSRTAITHVGVEGIEQAGR